MKTVLSKEWNFQADHKAILKAIARFLKSRPFEYGYLEEKKFRVSDFTKQGIQTLLGLPYTSTGDFAGIWVTNTTLYFDAERTWQIEGFAMGVNGEFFAYCQDENENVLLVRI